MKKISKWKQEKRLIAKKQNKKLEVTRTTQVCIIRFTAFHGEDKTKKIAI